MFTVRYSQGTNVNTPLCTRAQKWAPGPCVHIVFVISEAIQIFELAAKLMLENGVCQSEME